MPNFAASRSVTHFLQLWSEWVHSEKFVPGIEVSFEDFPLDIRDAVEAVVSASEVPFMKLKAAPEESAKTESVFLLVETIFADTERRQENLEVLLSTHINTLYSLHKQRQVEGVTALHITYCSVDKSEEYFTLAKVIDDLNARAGTFLFALIPYEHPAEGYPKPANGHIDAVILPNKYSAERFSVLSEPSVKALNNCAAYRQSSIFVRSGLDDDDLWSSNALSTISEVARAAAEIQGRGVKGIGIGCQMVYYPLKYGQLDRAQMRVVLTGSKFYMSRQSNLIELHSPYTLPESFSTNVRRQFRSQNVDLYLVRNCKPYFVYVRNGKNLSTMDKSQHYIDLEESNIAVGRDIAVISAATASALRRSVPPLTMDLFSIDPPTLAAHAELSSETSVLKMHGNFTEVVEAHGFKENDTLEVVINYSVGDGRSEVRMPFAGDGYEVLANGWVDRTLVRIENEGNTVASNWLRGSEPFLS